MLIHQIYQKIIALIGENKDAGKIERGAIFVVVILTLLIFTAFMFVGGNIPTKLPLLNTTNLVSVQEPKNQPAKNNLQLYTFEGVTLTPYPTLQAAPQVSTIPSSDVDCKTTIKGSEEPEVIWAYRIAQTAASGNQPSVQIFYNDEWAMPLGSKAMTKQPTDHITNPPINLNNRDENNFTISPALYITDITANAADTSGDAQNGGVPQPPSDVYGAWKTDDMGLQAMMGNRTDLGAGADAWPAANGPAGGGSQLWTAQIVWKIANLKTKTGAALEKGHTYRIQGAVHDGDSVGDIGEICLSFTMP